MYGYENVKSFMDEYNASKASYEAYQDAYAKWKNPPKPSARKKLEEKKVNRKAEMQLVIKQKIRIIIQVTMMIRMEEDYGINK